MTNAGLPIAEESQPSTGHAAFADAIATIGRHFIHFLHLFDALRPFLNRGLPPYGIERYVAAMSSGGFHRPSISAEGCALASRPRRAVDTPKMRLD